MPDLTPGFFGKLPSHGDFIDRGLDRSFISCWDAWLTRGLAASRQRLAPDWLDRYMVAPIWRFVLGPGICGEVGWQGILMPSVDRVNRHFPLTLALPCRSGQAPLAALLDDDDWFVDCEAVALEALTTGMDADRLWQRLAGLSAPRATARCLPPVPTRAWHFALPTPAVGAGLGWCLSEALLSQWDEPCSLWSSTGSDQVEPTVLLHRGLPDAEAFTALLNGEFAHHGWHSSRATNAWQPLRSAFYPGADGPTDPAAETPTRGAGSDPGAIAVSNATSDPAIDPTNGPSGDPVVAPDHNASAATDVAARPTAMPNAANGDPAGQAGPNAPAPTDRVGQVANDQPGGAPNA